MGIVRYGSDSVLSQDGEMLEGLVRTAAAEDDK
jgi:hypothetical protein